MLERERLAGRIDRLSVAVLDDVPDDHPELAVACESVILRCFAPTAIEQHGAGGNARAVIWTFSRDRAKRSNC